MRSTEPSTNSSPRRRALHERSASQTNETSPPPSSLRIVEDKDHEDEAHDVYSATPFPTNRSIFCYHGLAKGKNMLITRSSTPARHMISRPLHCRPMPAEPPRVVCSSSLSVIPGIYRPRLIPEILPHRCGKMTLNPAILLFPSQFFRVTNRPITGPLGVQMLGIPTKT